MDTSTPTADPPRWAVEPTEADDWAPPGRPEDAGYDDSPSSHDCTGEGDDPPRTPAADVVLPARADPFGDIPEPVGDVEADAMHRPAPPADDTEAETDGA